MFFKKNKKDLTEQLVELWGKDANAENNAKVFALATRLAEENQENIDAVYILAQCYYVGIGTEINYDKAVELFNLLANNETFDADNDVKFQIKYGDALEKLGDNSCLTWYGKAARNGDQYSAIDVANLLLESNLMIDIPYEQRYALAVAYYKRAVEIGEDEKVTHFAQDSMAIWAVKNEKLRPLEIEKQKAIMKILEDLV